MHRIKRDRATSIVILAALLCSYLLSAFPAFAQQQSVQEIQGSINPGEIDVFLLTDLLRGQTVYISMQTTSGDLDPFLGIVVGGSNLAQLRADYIAETQRVAQTAEYPLTELSALRDRYFLAWDDDSGPGYAVALAFTVPEDGDYILIGSGSLSAAGRVTAGDYRLLVGLDEPGVLSGEAVPNGATIAIPDKSLLGLQPRIQEATGRLNGNTPRTAIPLYEMDPGDILTVEVQVTAGDLRPILILRDYGGKPVEVANLQGVEQQAALEYAFSESGKSYYLEVTSAEENGVTISGDFRLLAGINAAQAMAEDAQPNSEDVLRLPIEVMAGFKLQEIVQIDQSNEIMTAVGTIKLEWDDPALAFSPDECNCRVKEYNETNFSQFLADTNGNWPDYSFFNQQGNRWIQNRQVEVATNGHVVYLERFTTDFQLNFEFLKYPFDRQDFYIHADMLKPESEYYLVPMQDFSQIDPDHGEDEFILEGFDTSVESVISSQMFPTSRYTFHFGAPRHLEYYIFRIFIPILLIISISYITFFLKDYTRRIEVATGNVLLFIAFSWSLAEDYPRMGYLTFLDAIMAITFIINALVVIYNVYLKWLESNEQGEKADRIDRVADWVYPIGYVVAIGLTILVFF